MILEKRTFLNKRLGVHKKATNTDLTVFVAFFIIISVVAASVSPTAQCVESTSLNVDVVIPSKTGRSNNWLRTFTACARVSDHLD